MEPRAWDSIMNFAVKFCNELGKDKTTVCSPISAESVLALLSLGCQNETHTELLKALDFPDDETLRSTFAYITSALMPVQGATFNVANKVYLQKGESLKNEIKNDAEKVFKSSLEQLDFKDTRAAAAAINKWVEQVTNKKIKNVVSPNILSNLTGLVLVNAIYFKGTWVKVFNKARTKNRNFHVNYSTRIKIPQMGMTEQHFKYKYSANLDAQ